MDPGAAYVFRYENGSWVEDDRFTSSDAAVDDRFGEFIALSGDVAVVGVPDYDDENDLGAVYVFRNDGAGTWTEEDKLLAPADSAEVPFGAQFGRTLDVSGDTLLVGAFNGFDDNGDRVGAVYVYRYDGMGGWDETAKLTGEGVDYVHQFGKSVALSGDTAVVGARGAFLADSAGLACVFWYDGASWVQQQTLTAPGSSSSGDSFINFGRSVAISETTVLVGHGSDEIYLFRNIPDIKLVADDGASGDDFGNAVALSDDMALVGAPGDDDDANSSGSAYLFRYDGANWFDEDKLTAPDAAQDDRFGSSVALAGDIAAIAAPDADLYAGVAYVYRYGGSSWGAGVELPASGLAADDQLGKSIAAAADTVVVGAPDADLLAGAAYVFWYNGASWIQQARLSASDAAAGHEFGSSVAISGDTLVVGAPAGEDTGAAGQAYVFRRDAGAWTQELPPLTASDGFDTDNFGRAVAISSDTLVVTGPGAAYVFGYDGASSAEEAKLTGSGTGPINGFGRAVAISDENTIVVGADFDEGFVGAAYVFWHDGEEWVSEPKFVPDETASSDQLGIAVSISGDAFLVGAPDHDDAGAAYVSSLQLISAPEPSTLALGLASLAALACVARQRA
jgi:hypothetical protein